MNEKATQGDGDFVTTHWSVVAEAGGEDSQRSGRALQELCSLYWYPLYAYIRRRGHPRADAEDLTQGFFAHFLERRDVAEVDAEHGRFRAYLLASLKHFLANDRARKRTLKRGGGIPHVSLDWECAETRFQVEGPSHESPDRAFDRHWVLTLLAHVLSQLETEYAEKGREEEFAQLKPFLTVGKGAVPYRQVAVDLGMQENAARVAVHRLRKRYRHLLEHEVAQTLLDPSRAQDELSALFEAFQREGEIP